MLEKDVAVMQKSGGEGTSQKLDWKANEALPVGKGATFQQWVANVGPDKLQMDVAPRGEGHLQLDGREIARIDGRQRQKPSLSQP
jgi:hypothetical protein